MKALTLALVAVWPAAMSVAQEKSASPQPRVRLDPQTRKAVTEVVPSAPAGAPTGSVGTPVVMMDRYVVKGQGAVPLGPQPLTPATGPFRLTEGGRLYQKELGAARVEAGMWAYADILAEDANFKGAPVRASWEFLRVKW